jgi:hypothetical protein
MRVIFSGVVFFIFSSSEAQEKQYQLTIAGGPSATLFFNHVKQPGFSIKIWGEKRLNFDESRYFLLALEYTSIGAAKSRTVFYDPTGTGTVTYTYHPSNLITLTAGGRKYLDNKLMWGVGMGLGITQQGVATRKYSDPLLNYVQYNKTYGGLGLGSTALIGYKQGHLQITLNYHGVLDLFRTVDLSDAEDRALSSFVAAFGVCAGYTF